MFFEAIHLDKMQHICASWKTIFTRFSENSIVAFPFLVTTRRSVTKRIYPFCMLSSVLLGDHGTRRWATKRILLKALFSLDDCPHTHSTWGRRVDLVCITPRAAAAAQKFIPLNAQPSNSYTQDLETTGSLDSAFDSTALHECTPQDQLPHLSYRVI